MVYKIVAPCAETSYFLIDRFIVFRRRQMGDKLSNKGIELVVGVSKLMSHKYGFIAPQDFDFNRKEITRQESHFAP